MNDQDKIIFAMIIVIVLLVLGFGLKIKELSDELEKPRVCSGTIDIYEDDVITNAEGLCNVKITDATINVYDGSYFTGKVTNGQ